MSDATNADTAADVAAMDIAVAENRDTGDRSGGNDVEPGTYEVETPVARPHDPIADPTITNADTATVVAAMDAAVAAAHGH